MLTKQTTDQIRKEAEAFAPLIVLPGINEHDLRRVNEQIKIEQAAYIAAATTWAVWKEKAERYEKALKEIRDYQPYPKTVFIEIKPGQFKDIGVMLKEKFGMSVDRFSGYIGRMLIKGNQEIATKALNNSNNLSDSNKKEE